mmetsp:Transcript_46445/g.81739  ORF Transcript_46445/g.81739 Transcript_46445/m.81739 type:complete len:280 (+) Transcript_46445:1342-2181(+)
MSNSFRALVIVIVPPSSCSSMSVSLKERVALSEGMPVQMCSSSFAVVFPGHCEQLAGFLHVSVGRQYNLSAAAQVIGELDTVAIPPREESSFSCISIQTCIFPIFVFLFPRSRGHFLAHLFFKVTLSLPTEAVFQLEVVGTMLSKSDKPSTYLYLLLECFPSPVKLKLLLVMFTEGSVTSNAPGAFQRTVNLTVKKMQVSFCAHWNAGATCCAMPYFGFSVRNSSSASSFRDRTALRTAKDRSTCCVCDLATISRAKPHHCRRTTFSTTCEANFFNSCM